MFGRVWRGLFGPPARLRPLQQPETGRHASWLELFFDLVFVVAVSQVAHLLGGDLTPAALAQFAALFTLVWWSWLGYTFYADFFESDDLFYRLTMFSGMFGMAALAVSAPHALDGGAVPFVWSFLAVRAFLLLLYLRARVQVPVARAFADRFLLASGAGATFWLSSLFVPDSLRPWLWAVGFVVEATSLWVRNGQLRALPFDSEHIPERFGLFVILVLGEAVLAVTGGIAGEEWGVRAVLVGALCFGLAASLWWLYFDFTETGGARGGWSWRTQEYIYSHLPLALGLVLVGVGAEHAILEAEEATLPPEARLLLAGGSALALLAMTALRLSAGGAPPAVGAWWGDRRAPRLAGAGRAPGSLGRWNPGPARRTRRPGGAGGEPAGRAGGGGRRLPHRGGDPVRPLRPRHDGRSGRRPLGGLRGLPPPERPLGRVARLPDLWLRGLLRLQQEPPRDRTLPCGGTPGHALL